MAAAAVVLFCTATVGCGGSSSPGARASDPAPTGASASATPTVADNSAYIAEMERIRDSLNPSAVNGEIRQASNGAISLAAEAMTVATPPAGLEADHESVRLILVGATMETNEVARAGLIGSAQGKLGNLIMAAK